jgi:cytochrome P450
MNLVSELDLPSFDYMAPDFSADRYHQQLAETRQLGWLAKSPLAYMVLDHDSGEFFLRSRATRFPGRQIAEFFGVTGGPLAEHIDTNILNLAGDQHRRLRALVGPALAPRAAARWRPAMRGFLEHLWARVAAYGQCDVVTAVARPYPALTIATVLGAPHERGVIFPAGTIVAVCAERANREGDDGERFDITAVRDARLLTFGAGTHYCLGANLARAELEEALAFLAPRTHDLALDGPPQLGGVEGIYGIDKLPIIWSVSPKVNPNHGPVPYVS